MPSWYIEPRDPLIVRDGRPFGADPGARARSLGFPVPSTTTGGFRGRAGLGTNGAFNPAKIDDVLTIAVRGPLLAALAQDGAFGEWLPPAPADALLLEHIPSEDERTDARATEQRPPDARLLRLTPLIAPAGAEWTAFDGAELLLVGPRAPVSAKPLAKPPRFWRWDRFVHWLTDPMEGLQRTDILGLAGPVPESRTHVGIEPATQTAEEGRLFQTSGLEFTAPDRGRLALVVVSEAPLPQFAQGGLAPLGGERRLAAWRPGAPELPACPPNVRRRIREERACRVLLLSPAQFVAGYLPAWLLGAHGGVVATLRGAVVQRPQVISGWDMRRGRPKETRRLAPSGSVFFLKLPEHHDVSDEAVDAWVDAIWMQNISDGDQERLDGFGLAALGTWDGKEARMEVQP